jgi:paraquat-inducible protein B
VTEVHYLGLPVGLVESTHVNLATKKVEAIIRLAPGYENLSKEGSVFTLVRPRISLDGISGVETLIAGIFIDCVPGSGSQFLDHFAGNTINSLSAEQGVSITLHASDIPTLDQGSPVLFRGILVGRVREKTFDEHHRPMLTVVIQKEFSKTLTTNTKFWRVPATSVQAGPGVLNMEIASIESLWRGGIAYDVFGEPGEPVAQGARFELAANERVARADSPPIQISFASGQGLLVGRTQLRYLGVPVGIVEEVTPSAGKVLVRARLEQGYEYLRRKGSRFSLIRPAISMEGVTGLEALVSGVYIECHPIESGSLGEKFIGTSASVAQSLESAEAGFKIVITSQATHVSVNAPVFTHGVRVGKIIRKDLARDGKSVMLTASISYDASSLLREQTRFWEVSGIHASLGFLTIKIKMPSLETLALGGITFATPEENAGKTIQQGHHFPLYTNPCKEWLRH